MTTQSPPLPVGVYRLTQDVANPGPWDKRKYDWTYAEIFEKGLLVRIVPQRQETTEGGVDFFQAQPWDEFGRTQPLRLDDPRFLALLPHLAPETDPYIVLNERIRQLTSVTLDWYAVDVMDALLCSGELKPERVVAIVMGLDKASTEEDAAERTEQS